MRPKILLVDDQADVLRVAMAALPAATYDIRTALDGAEAWLLAREWTPDLVVTDVNMPGMDGFALVMKLRAYPKLALVPVIFLTARSGAEDRIHGFRLGADDYLDKSTGFWELPERAARALAKGKELGAAVAKPGAPAAVFAGRCEVIGLAAVLTVLDGSRRSGILRLKRERPPEEGVVYLVDGRVRRAELGAQRGREAIFSLMTWSDGSFEFSPSALRVGDDVDMTTPGLLVEAARRLDGLAS